MANLTNVVVHFKVNTELAIDNMSDFIYYQINILKFNRDQDT